MNLKELKDKFNHLALLITNWISYPNSGGCAVIASLVAQYMPINCVGCTVLNFTSDKNKFYNILGEVMQGNVDNTLKNWNNNGVTFSHIVATYMIDGVKYYFCSDTGLVTAKEYKKISEYGNYSDICLLPVDICHELGNTAKGWNKCFGRDQIPKIKELVEEVFGSSFVQSATV